MNSIAFEFEDLLKLLRTRPYKITDAMVNLKCSEEKPNAYIIVDSDTIDSQIENDEREVEKRFKEITGAIQIANFTSLAYVLLGKKYYFLYLNSN